MYKDFKELADKLGLSESVIRKYRQIGLLDDLVEVVQEGKVKHLKINKDLPQRIKNIQKLQKEGYELKTIMHKLVPISIYELSIGNKRGTHRMEKQIRFTFVTSDIIETVFLKNESQKVSEDEMKKIRDMLIEEGNYDLAEKINFTPKKFTFLFDEFENTIFDAEFLKKQRMLRTIQDSMKPLQWYEQTDGELVMNELYSNKIQFENYNRCLRIIPVVKYTGIDKYVIRYHIGFRFLNEIQFSDQYSYLKGRLIKIYKKKMKEINISDADDEFQGYTLANIVSDKERRLIEIIKNNDFDKIIITKKDSEKLLVTKNSIKKGNFDKSEVMKYILDKDFQQVKVIRNNGKNITLNINETELI
jgi:hypothetical protein